MASPTASDKQLQSSDLTLGGKRQRATCSKSSPRRHFWLLLLTLVATLLPRASSSSSLSENLHRQTQQQNSIKLDYFASPQLKWTIRLQDEPFYHGNAVVQSPFDDNLLYATTHTGKVVVIQSQDGSIVDTIAPTPRSVTVDGKTEYWTLYCTSGIAFGESADGKDKFLVYLINDLPPEDSLYDPKTRAVAVSIPNHEILWTSSGFTGTGNDSPVVYKNEKDGINYVLFTHNSELLKPDNTTLITGHVTLLQTVKGKVVWTESEWSRDELPRGYGPPGITPSPQSGAKYAGGSQNQNDLVAWTSNDGEGRGLLGSTFAFQLPTGFGATDAQITDLKTQVLKKVRWNSVTRPVFSADGASMFVGVTGSALRGWVGETLFDETADWASDLVHTPDDPLAAIPTAPVLSRDEKRLYVPTASTEVHCVNTENGRSLWDLTGTSSFLAEARVSPDDERVYVIQSVDGRIFCHDQMTGELLWLVNCNQFEEDCANSVRAHFDLSRTGQFLYYADVMGRIIALEVGELRQDLTPPPAPNRPSIVDWNNPNGQSENQSKSGPSIAGSVALIVLASFVAIGSTFYIVKLNRHKAFQQQEQQRQLDEGYEDDYALPGHLGNAPDPYEDSMISKHPKSRSEGDAWYDDYAKASFDDDSVSHAPADRLSLLLGTSNRIAPLREDFGYGASVLV